MRLSRLRQRRVDGYLSGQQRALRFLQAGQAPAQRALQEQSRRHVYRRHGEGRGAGGTFGMGVAVGDYDNDGWPDMLVTSYGRCILYRNNRDGTFTDVTEKAGLAARAGPPAPSGSTTITTESWTCSSAASSITYRASTLLRRQQVGHSITTAFRASSSPPPASCITTTATARSPRSRREPILHAPSARAWAWSRPTSIMTG